MLGGLTGVFGIKGMAIVGGVCLLIGSAGGYTLADKLGEAKVLRIEKAQQAATIAALQATVAQRDRDLAANARLAAGVNGIATNVIAAINDFKEGLPDEDAAAPVTGCDAYSDADYERVRNLIDRAANLGQVREKGSALGGKPGSAVPSAGPVKK
jgi:hypothetical protein